MGVAVERDVADETAVDATFDRAREEFDGLEIRVTNGRIWLFQDFLTTSAEQSDE